MALANFTPTGYGYLVAPSPAPNAYSLAAAVQATAALPGGGGVTLIVTNAGPSAAAVLLYAVAGGVPTVTPLNGIVVAPNTSENLAVGSNDHIAAIGLQSNAQLSLCQGA